MISHDELLDGVAAYALGALSAHDAAEVRAHLQSCAECRAEYEALAPAVTAVAYSSESCADAESGAAVASPLLKARIMRQVRSDAERPRRAAAWPVYVAAAACLVLAAASALENIALRGQLNRDTQTIGDLTAGDTVHRKFGNGEVLERGSRVYLAMRALPATPPGKVYQAWTLPSGSKKMAPSVTFRSTGSGVTLVRLPQPADGIAAVAVSVEPDGGSKQPTSTPIAVTQL